MSKVITLIGLGLLAYYWAHTQKLKSIALRAAIKRCGEAGVQFLDHSVVQKRIQFQPDSNRRWRFQRQYRFDFTSTGEHRYHGHVTLQGRHIIDIELDPFLIN